LSEHFKLTASAISWPSPAKLNLFLYINGRRSDGYHELQTLFQFLDFGDDIDIAVNDSGRICLDVGDNQELNKLASEQNLIVKAAKALQLATNSHFGANIKLTKRLPMGGGLGGGSSNAATTLVALNHQWQLNLSLQQLADIGLTLGADVPVFVKGESAFAEGVGEKLLKVNPTEHGYLVLVPEIAISTAELFNAPELPRNTPKRSWDILNNGQWSNDCEKIACKLYPEIGNQLSWLLNYAPSRMTGTGSCLFAQFDSITAAQQVHNKLPQGVNAFIAQGINRSPLLSKLAELDVCT